MNPHTILRRPLLTEKLTKGKGELNIVAFEVDRRANKIQIRQAIELIFKVKVVKLNTVVLPGKSRRLGGRQGVKKPWKKAVAQLRKGDRIAIYEGV